METKIVEQLFSEHCLQDVLPQIQQNIDNYCNNTKFEILGHEVIFENAGQLSNNCLHAILAAVKKKYHDFDQMIDRTCNNMRSQFYESHRCKLYVEQHIDHLLFNLVKQDAGYYQFKVIVFETGKGQKSYWMSMGKIFVVL